METQMKSNLSIFLKEKRKLLEISQKDLADRAGVGLDLVNERAERLGL